MSGERTRSMMPRAVDGSSRLRLIVFCNGVVTSHRLPAAGQLVLGRGEEAHVRVDHGTVSRKHATLTCGERLTIVDHGSFNGTSIGGRRVAPHVAHEIGLATIVELGDTMVVVQVDGANAVTGSSAPASSSARPHLSPAMQHLYKLADHVAQSNITVVLRGETGVGKEVLAEHVHRASPRAQRPLVRLNCAALPEQLLEGELFGYERGAFTGATQAKPGLIESADTGTLFLDEVGELPLATQAKLLRVVEAREVMRLGSLRPKAVDLRIVCATHRDLEAMVDAGHFRQDLYFRLNGVSLFIPPLRERRTEIRHIATELVARFCRESKRPILDISPAAIAALEAHPFPGNVRELRNVIERAVVFCRGIALMPEHLALHAARPPSAVPPPASHGNVVIVPPHGASIEAALGPLAAGGVAPTLHDVPARPGTMVQGVAPTLYDPPRAPTSAPPPPPEGAARTALFGAPAPASAPPPPPPPQEASGTMRLGSSLPAEMEQLERERIVEALAACGGNQTEAAERLGISRRTLLRRLDAYDLPRPRKG